jgi:hypothetical protein
MLLLDGGLISGINNVSALEQDLVLQRFRLPSEGSPSAQVSLDGDLHVVTIDCGETGLYRGALVAHAIVIRSAIIR